MAFFISSLLFTDGFTKVFLARSSRSLQSLLYVFAFFYRYNNHLTYTSFILGRKVSDISAITKFFFHLSHVTWTKNSVSIMPGGYNPSLSLRKPENTPYVKENIRKDSCLPAIAGYAWVMLRICVGGTYPSMAGDISCRW